MKLFSVKLHFGLLAAAAISGKCSEMAVRPRAHVPAVYAHEHHEVSEIDMGEPFDWVIILHASAAYRAPVQRS